MQSALHWVSAGWGDGAPEPQKALGLQLMQGEKQLTPPAPPEFWLLPCHPRDLRQLCVEWGQR